ncbi:hypothetical protein I4U23_004324 [Adineta vaga]|nr:hypothetical protein I4U23_004324 [Adineta vaga]
MKNIDPAVFTPNASASCEQLTSLTLKKTQRSMSELELLLSCTPSLTHLKLISDLPASNTLFDGARWEFFIEQRLPQLEKFEFFLSNTQVRDPASINIDLLIARFETPFWLHRKRWFIMCNYIPDATRLNLYTLPICETLFLYNFYSKAISRTTSSSAANDEGLMNNVRTIRMNLTQAAIDLSEKKNECLTAPRQFRRVNELRVIVDGEWPIGSHQFLSQLIDLSYITKIMLGIDFHRLANQCTATDIRTLLEQTCNLCSLEFLRANVTNQYNTAIENVLLMIPSRVKHLRVSAKTLDDMTMILEQLKHLSSVSFQLNALDSTLCQQLFKWLAQSGRDFTQRQYKCCIQLWLGKIT